MEIRFMSISLDPDSLHIIDKFCKNNSLNRSEFVRKTVLEKINKENKKNDTVKKTNK
jgi:metal-responsive CopG/Arc/MetJ family transcriptional regulator